MKTIPYATQSISRADVMAVSRALRRSYLTQGPLVREFEDAVAGYCGAKYAVAVNSGTSALHIACLAAGITRGDEVITTPNSFVATANCVLYCGGNPVFVDIKDDTANIDPEEINKKVTRKTKAIIPVDFAGQPCEYDKIRKIARKHKLLVIADASHSMGSIYKSSLTGSGKYADMTVFSFHAVKNMTTGEGGMVMTNNKSFYDKLVTLRAHGITRDPDALFAKDEGKWFYEMQDLGFNYRITDFQCALGLSQLKRLDDFMTARRDIAERYDAAFQDFEELKPLRVLRDASPSRHLYALRFKKDLLRADRKQIFEDFQSKGILVNVHYIPIYKHPFYQRAGFGHAQCPRAEEYYAETISLPIFYHLRTADVRRIISATKNILYRYRLGRS